MYIKVLISHVFISISRSTSYSNDSNIFPIEINTIICINKACLRDKTETYTLQKAQSQYYLRDEVPQDDD